MLTEHTPSLYYFGRKYLRLFRSLGDLKWFGFAFLFCVLYGLDSNVPAPDDPEFKRFMELDALTITANAKSFMFSLGSSYFGEFLLNKLDIMWPFEEMAIMIRKWHRMQADKGRKDEDSYFHRMTEFMKEGQITVYTLFCLNMN